MNHSPIATQSDKPIFLAMGVIGLLYALATAAGWTAVPTADHHAGNGHAAGVIPHYIATMPFVLLLGAIATFPLIPKISVWWDSNTHRLWIAVGLAGLTLLYYLFFYPAAGIAKVQSVLDHAILQEYIPFIVLLFSLYSIAGGIRIQGDLPAHSGTNAMFLGIGSILASFIGTTGAAMLLIRPLLETNAERKYVRHTIVFFIFMVCNTGGCLLPIGDPPLFLGYLEGVPFLWTLWGLWKPWLFVNVALLAAYYLLDAMIFYRKERAADLTRDERQIRPLQIRGLWPNAALLVGVIITVACLDPRKPIPFTAWHPWIYLREVVQIGLVGLSLWLGSREVRQANRFTYHAIVEVAALFVGIFICMQPALEILGNVGPQLGINTPDKFFWVTGSLSSVLDNAPTYLVFFKTAAASQGGAGFTQLVASSTPEGLLAQSTLAGISLGAVFMGAMTYIGNGPNFMVRAIAEESGVRMPSFFGYVLYYSVPVLLPIFYLTTRLFV